MQLLGLQIKEKIEKGDTANVRVVHASCDGNLYSYGPQEGVKVDRQNLFLLFLEMFYRFLKYITVH